MNAIQKAAVKSRLTPQARKVLDHMIAAGSISNVEAHAVHAVRSVSRRITEIGDAIVLAHLEDDFDIRKERRTDVTGQRYVRYHLQAI